MSEHEFEQAAQDHYKREMESLNTAMEPSSTCNECGEQFEDYDESGECPECFSTDTTAREYEDSRQAYVEGVLEFRKFTTFQVTLSTGGPADGYILYVDQDGYIVSAEYWYQDWLQPKRKFVLSGDELDNVRNMFECWTEGV